MPVFVLGGVALAALAAGVIALLLLFAGPALARIIGGAIKNLPVVGGYAENVVNAAITAIDNTTRVWADSILHGLGELVWAVGAGTWQIVNRIVDAYQATYNATVSVKNYASGLFNQAIAYVQGIANDIYAGMRTMQTNLSNYAVALYDDAIRYTQQVENDILTGMRDLQANVTALAESLFNQAIAYTNGIANDIYAGMRALQSNVTALAQSLYNQAIAHTNQVESDLLTGMRDLQSNLQAEINSVQSSLGAEIQSVDSALGKAIGSALSDAEAYTAAAAKTLQTSITGVATEAQAEATQAEHAAISTAEAAGQALVSPLAAEIGGAIGADIIGPWDQLLPDLKDVVGAIGAPAATALGLPGAITEANPSTITGLLSVLVPTVGALAHEVATCSVPMCDNLGGLSTLFGDLADFGTVGVLIGLAGQAVDSPGGAVSELRTVAVAPLDAAATAARDLVGV